MGAALERRRRIRAYSASSKALLSVTKSPVRQITSGLASKPSSTDFSIKEKGTADDACKSDKCRTRTPLVRFLHGNFTRWKVRSSQFGSTPNAYAGAQAATGSNDRSFLLVTLL